MKIYVDIDGTIFNTLKVDGKWDYKSANPIQAHLDKINKLYYKGNEIVYWTARGCHSGEDYTDLTKQQFLEWGVKYHDLQVGNKPHFDMYICDKSFNSESFFHYRERGLP